MTGHSSGRRQADKSTAESVVEHVRLFLLCESAGYDFIIVETVGVGQSEFAVSHMTDLMILLVLPRSGDELQGVKRGVLEFADAIVVTKADGDNKNAANIAKTQFLAAMQLFGRGGDAVVFTCSALRQYGINEVFSWIVERLGAADREGRLTQKRAQQNLQWMWHTLESDWLARLKLRTQRLPTVGRIELDVIEGKMLPSAAASRIMQAILAAEMTEEE